MTTGARGLRELLGGRVKEEEMDKECCGNCRFFNKTHCRAHPPTMFLVPGRLTVGNKVQMMAMSEYPPNKPENWCGEWKEGVKDAKN